MAETKDWGSAGQSAPRRRVAGQWVEEERPQGLGPVESENDESDLSKLSRAELDTLARERGLDPAEFRNAPSLREALES